jgi:hypothetical protein
MNCLFIKMILVVAIISLIQSVFSMSAKARGIDQSNPSFALSYTAFDADNIRNDLAMSLQADLSRAQKKTLLSITAAILPGYLIPGAFGHMDANRSVEGALLSMTRLSGRVMWIFSLFSSLLGKSANESIMSATNATMLMAGLGLDVGGYAYDVANSPAGFSGFKRVGAKSQKSFTFIKIVGSGPCLGLVYHF